MDDLLPTPALSLTDSLLAFTGSRRLNVLEVGHGAGHVTVELLRDLPAHSVLVTVDDHLGPGAASPADFGRVVDAGTPPFDGYRVRCLPIFRPARVAFGKITPPPWFDAVVWVRGSLDAAAAFWGEGGLPLCAARCVVAFAPAAPGMSEGARGAGFTPLPSAGGGGTCGPWSLWVREEGAGA